MYACMNVCVYVCVYVYMYACMNVCMYVCIQAIPFWQDDFGCMDVHSDVHAVAHHRHRSSCGHIHTSVRC